LNNSAGDEDSEWLELGEDEGKEQYDPELLKQLDNWFNPQQPDNSVSAAAGRYLPNNNNLGGADDANGLGAFQSFIFPADSGGAVAGADDEEYDNIDNNIRELFEYDNDGDAGTDDDVGGADVDLDAFDFDPYDDDFDYHYGGSKNFYKKNTKKRNKTKKINRNETKKRNRNKRNKTKKRNRNRTKKRNKNKTKKRNKNKTKK
jgi:hypothetical protein